MAYSNSQIDRAGQFVVQYIQDFMAGNLPSKDRQEIWFRELHKVEWWRSEHARPLSRVAASLRYYAAQEGRPVVAQRLKKLPTIGNKLGREPTMKLSRMADIGGVRAVFLTQDAAYMVAAKLKRNWTITRFRDYVAEPKQDGYRALHLINRNRGRLIEVQLRTMNQDMWANDVESASRMFAPGLKYGGGPESLRVYFMALAESYARIDQRLPHDPVASRRIWDALNGRSTLKQFLNDH
jgi:ppGpp synthetase/RelA/SpoT-type nucleotidyltranferase